MCCGTVCGNLEELRQHLQTRHAEPLQAIDCFVDMIVYYHSNDGDAECRWCKLNYEDHLAECSVLRHFVTFLVQPLKHHGGRGTKPDAGNVRSHAAKLQSRPNKRAEAPKDQRPIGDFFKRQQRRRLQSSTIGGTLVLRHERDVQALLSQCSFIMFLGTSQESILSLLMKKSLDWKQAKTVELPLRVVLLKFILNTMLERAQKISACSKKDPLWAASLKSNLILEDGSWPFLIWNSQTKALEVQPKKKAITMEDMLTELQEIITMTSKDKAIVRFHSLKSPQGQEQVCPWKLDVDLKHPMLHELQQSGRKQCVAAGGHQDEGSQSKPKQDGRLVGSAIEATSEIQKVVKDITVQLGCCLQQLSLVNNDTQCYLNASFLTVCWCHLQCRGFDAAQWPMVGDSILQMIVSGQHAPLELCSHKAMQTALHQWNQPRGQGQQDLSEFFGVASHPKGVSYYGKTY